MAQFFVDTGTPDPSGTRTAIYVTRQLSPGKLYVDYRWYRLLSCSRLLTGTVDLTTAYVAMFGQLVEGKLIGVRVRRIRVTGASSGFTSTTTTVVGVGP